MVTSCLAAVVSLGCGDSTGTDDSPPQAVVTFAFDGHPQDTLLVLFKNQAAIAQAISYINTHQGPKFPIGPILRGSGSDPRYPFHYDPDSVQLAELAIELCDGRPMRTVAELDAFMQGATGNANAPRATWCPWGAYPIKVEELARL